MITVADAVEVCLAAIERQEESAILALTDPNVTGERAAFERGRLAGLKDARREARRAYQKATEEE